MGNILMNLLGGGGNNPGTDIMMQAFGAMMRGESPKTFLQNLAGTNPKLQGIDFNNLETAAKTLCQQNNVNMNELAAKIQEFANSNTTKS